MVAFVEPEAFAPAAVVIVDNHLRAVPSEYALRFPVPGAWRSFAESDPSDLSHILAIADRFGGLTAGAAAETGEPLRLWVDLIETLQTLSVAWTETGELTDPVDLSTTRLRARGLLNTILMHHRARDGWFVVENGEWAMNGLDMWQWWQLAAIHDVQVGDAMRRCRHCNLWFSLTGLRGDASFCSAAHRSAFYQKRRPASRFWAKVA